ncbi:MAG TPA: hypothetical protein VN730_09060 [Steroidobacteraceae bacterium]|nr:hypothetical protein [Steroidobacteraceae bacterium]
MRRFADDSGCVHGGIGSAVIGAVLAALALWAGPRILGSTPAFAAEGAAAAGATGGHGTAGHAAGGHGTRCGRTCLERIGDQYRAAYVKHDPSLAPIASTVRFSENNVMLKFPDGTWDTVTEEVGPALTFSDPVTGEVGIYTSIMQKDTPGFLAIRLRVRGGKIIEIEHVLATRRYVSSPPVVFGKDVHLHHNPQMAAFLTPAERRPRAELVKLADGYYNTLQHNDGTVKTVFTPNCLRLENGLEATDGGCEQGFKLGMYAANDRVRGRDYFLVDEARGLVMARLYIDHKGVLDTIKLTDGRQTKSVFREPQTWAGLEVFKITNGAISSVEADFINAPYYIPSVWTGHAACPAGSR